MAASTLRVREYRNRIQAANALVDNNLNQFAPNRVSESHTESAENEAELERTMLAAVKTSWPHRRGGNSVPSVYRLAILEAALQAITKIVKPRSKKPKVHGLQYAWYFRVYLFLRLQVRQEQKVLKGPDVFTGIVPAIESRKVLAKKVADGGAWGNRICRRIMRQEVSWVKQRTIEQPRQGQHQKILFMLEDADTILAVRTYINSVGDSKFSFSSVYNIQHFVMKSDTNRDLIELTSEGLARAVTEHWQANNDEIRNRSNANFTRQVAKAISSSTASRWLRKLGFKWKEYRKAVYNDGHERPDVKQYRQDVFLPLLESYRDRLMTWDASLQELPPPAVQFGIKDALILVTQDECTFHSNDGAHYLWVHEEHKPLRKKGRGKGLHVSDFLTPIGRLGDGGACVIMPCGGDTWWTGDRLLEQVVEKAIPAFEAQFPGCQALFAFDNSRNHLKYAEDALRVTEMNLEPGGTNKKIMRDTFVTDPREPGGGYIQLMKLPSGIPKGLRLVLTERGLWPNDHPNFRAQCSIPTKTGKGLKPNPICLQGGTCCARALLAAQPDFQAQKSQLQEAIERAGHLVVFYPAFHCEINFIEYYWGAAKQYTRKHCEYDFESLQRLVPEALASISPQLIWKYHARTERIMDAYHRNIVYASPEYENLVHTKYKSHRRVSTRMESE